MLWLLEDLEPWPDAPAAGDICEPTTYWASRDEMDLPDIVCCEISARIEVVDADGQAERVAHLGHGFSTMLRKGDDRVGDVTLVGCLVWDRYLWLDYRTRPAGQLRVLERRGHLIQHETLTPTRYGGSSVAVDGPMRYSRNGKVPTGFGIRWNAIVVESAMSDRPGEMSP